MSYEIHLSISEDSVGGHLIASVSAKNRVTPSQAARQIIEDAAKSEPAEPDAHAVRETPEELVRRLRARTKGRPSRVPADPSGSEALIGMLAGDKEFGRIMDEIIASRPMRYGFEK